MTDYLTVAEVLAMHADQIERYGGSPGLRRGRRADVRFVAMLYEETQFRFDKLVPWLRAHVAPEPGR